MIFTYHNRVHRQTIRHLSTTTTIAADHHRLKTINSKTALLNSFIITPPITPWPKHLHPKNLIPLITQQQNLDLALQIFHHADNYHLNFTHNYRTYLSIVQKLARAKQFDRVENLLRKLSKTDIVCEEILFIVVIRCYGLAGFPKLALRTFLKIESFNVGWSVRSLNTLLNALFQNKMCRLVYLMFKSCGKKFGIVPNVFTCNFVLKALFSENDVDSAVKVFDEMPQMGILRNVGTYTTMLNGYVSKGDLIGAEKVFQEIMGNGWLPDATTYTILMDGFCRQRRVIDAIKVMNDMEKNGVEPNEVTYGVMIKAYCKEKNSKKVLSLLEAMVEKKYIPSSSLCCKVIEALCEDGHVEIACASWKKLLKNNVTPSNAVSVVLIHWLCEKGKMHEAKKLFEEFEKDSAPSVLTYNTLISGMCEFGELQEAGKLWDDMVEKGLVPNVFTYNMLIKGFCKVGNPKEGITVLEEMLSKGCLPNKLTYSILIEGLLQAGSEEDIVKVRSLDSSRIRKVDVDSWKVFVNNVSESFESRVILDRLLKNSKP